MTQSPRLSHLDHLVLTVADLDRTIAFYQNVLGMAALTFEVADGTVRHALGFGNSKINLHQRGSEFEPKARNPQPGSVDLCFLTAAPLADWVTFLEGAGIDIEEGPVPRSGATGPITSIYLRDPDGNLIEIGTSDTGT